jgi:hypothetical protein
MYSLTSAQISNGDFEELLYSGNDTIPKNWTFSYPPFSGGITTDAYSGKYAVYVSNWYQYITGSLVYGIDSIADIGMPVSISPVSLTGYYKYLPGDTKDGYDSAVAEIYLFKRNDLKKSYDTVATGIKKLAPVEYYTPFEIRLIYNTELKADIMFIRFKSSVYSYCENLSCCYLYIDNLKVTE